MEEWPILRFENICKDFPGVVALDNVSFGINKGEIHGLVGENGAGKSTLVNVLAGTYATYGGSVYHNGHETKLTNWSASKNIGICPIFQEPNVILPLDVATNVFLGKEPGLGKAKFFLNKNKRLKITKEVLDENLKVDINIKALCRDLSISEQQIVGILKGLVSQAEIFILDEPTSSLTRSEINNLFRMIKELKNKGNTIIFISHRLDEIFDITDSITVLRDGKHIITKKTKNFDYGELINAMVGRKIESRYPRNASYEDEVLLEVKNFSSEGKFENINLTLHKGEVFGLGGVVGAGRTEVVKALFGAGEKLKGETLIKGEPVKIKSPQDAIKHGIGLLTEDRRNESLILISDVMRNIIMSKLGKVVRRKFIRYNKARNYANEYVKLLDIKTPSLAQKVEFLSGGNQQKVVFSKWLFADSQILFLDEPTKGIDVGAKFEIYKIIRDLSEKGVGIIIISAEIPELLGLCHNITILHEGKQVKTLKNENLTQDKILSLALGENGEKNEV